MLTKTIRALAIAISGVCLLGFNAIAQTNVPSTFKHIAIDGSFNDWTGVPLAYTAPVGSTNAIQYQNVYIANDQTNLYVRFTLYSPRPNAMANSFDNIFIDADTNALTGFPADGGAVGIGSEMLIQWGAGYQEKNGLFNEGAINNLGWNIAGSPDSTDFEFVISLGATYASDGTSVFASNTIAILLEGDNTTYTSVEFAPPYGGLVYTFATQPTTLTTNVPLITLTNSWQANAAGRDLGTNWLGQTYDDTSTGWTAGSGLLGYTPSPGSYPAINTPLVNGPNTYYFRTHFAYTNDADNVAFVVTNYLSDGAVYYLNGNEIRRVRMPGGIISYATAASTTNSPAGHADIFGIDGSSLQFGDNILEVETHQAPASSADMVFGLSLTATTSYSILNASTNLPADYNVLAGQSITFVSDVIGSGPLTYQWFFDGTQAIPGANASTYTIPYVLTNNAGTYSLQVSNSFSGVTTRAAILTVSNTPVVITTQPVNQAAVEGRSASFSAVVSGTPLIQYQWSFNGVPISGATNSSYVIPVTYPTNAGVYQLTANNPASTTNSSQVNLTVLLDNLPPKFTTINAAANQIVVTFSEPVDTVTSENISKYSVSGGVTVLSAVQSSSNPAQVTLTTGGGLNSGTVYTLTVNGVADLFGNVADVSGQFTPVTTITIDGSFDDWAGVTPIYSSAAPSGNTGAADFKDIYTYDDANYYYFYVVLWSDIDPSAGHFPAYVNMFFNTDNNAGTGYGPGALGSDLLIQSGYGYDERNGSFNNGTINGLNWFCLPAAPGTNFEFSISKAATYASDNAPVFTTNVISFIFQGMNTSYVVVNQVPASGIITYNDATTTPVAPLPLGKLSVASLPNKQAAIVWDLPGTLQVSSSLVGATWTNLPAASSPYVVPVASGNLFFRLTE
jgi:hypothetical protein